MKEISYKNRAQGIKVKNGHATGKIAGIKSCLRVDLKQNVSARYEMELCKQQMRLNMLRFSLVIKIARVNFFAEVEVIVFKKLFSLAIFKLC